MPNGASARTCRANHTAALTALHRQLSVIHKAAFLNSEIRIHSFNDNHILVSNLATESEPDTNLYKIQIALNQSLFSQR